MKHLWLLMLVACAPSGFPVPDQQPYTFEEVIGISDDGQALFVDLTGDNWDEIVSWAPQNPLENRAHITIRTHDSQTIDQVNFAGRISQPKFLDIEGDGMTEILVPVIQGDSLFVTSVNFRGDKLNTIFLTSGSPRIEPDGNMPWDPSALKFFALDVMLDEAPELVTVVQTGFARLPRGILIHTLDGVLLRQCIVGASMGMLHLLDVDDDGHWELLVAAGSADNGAIAGGFDDVNSYLLEFGLSKATVN